MKRMTREQFIQATRCLTMGESTREIAEGVLVKGIAQSDFARSLSDNRYECLIFCGAIMQKKQDWACKTTFQITHS